MNKNLITWKLKPLVCLCSIFGFGIIVFLLIYTFNNFSVENLVGTIIASLSMLFINIFLILIVFVWKIEVLSDRIIVQGMFGKKVEYKFINIAVYQQSKYLAISNKEGKNVLRISYLLDNYDSLIASYNTWKKNNTPIVITSKQVKHNSYTKIFAITFLSIGIVTIIFFIITLLTVPEETETIIVFGVLAGLCLLVGVMFLLLYKKWLIIIDNEWLIFTNIFGKTKRYDLKQLSYRLNNITLDIMYKNKKVIKIFIHLVDNCSLVNNKLKEYRGF